MKEKTFNWWYCDNYVHPRHKGQIGLLHLGEPNVFILIKDDADAYFCSFEDFIAHIAEVNFLYPEEKASTAMDELLADAWNFMALAEEADDEGAMRFIEEMDGGL